MVQPATTQSNARIPLNQLKRGQRATVDCSALTELPERERCLLAAMGMADACKVRVCRSGSPCIIQVDTTRIGLSRELASRITVTLCDRE
ncbi:MAG: ferrous iron transport protein A [Phycisphaerales bacterium]|nr:ferrous iron transport protein A [Phycisphaerales bacterium]